MEIMVKQYSFCPKCKGHGRSDVGTKCPECKGRGTVYKLIPLDSLPKVSREEYARVQADFIAKQKVAANS